MSRLRRNEEDPFSGIGDSTLTSQPVSEESADEDVFPDPSPSRANVLAALAIADDEEDLELADYYVQRAIAESLLLIVDGFADPLRRSPKPDS